VPLIIVTGDSDQVVPPQANAYRLKAEIGQSQLLEIKHAGHEIPQTQPQSILNALKLISNLNSQRSVP
jgi:pimeloyl-ACP methyl ester carboxylesterase